MLGDISMRNTLWSLDEGGAVFGLDCDSYRVACNRPAVDQPDTPDWDDAHARLGLATLDSDRYKLALLVVRILAREATVRPEDLRDDSALLHGLPEPVRALFVAAAVPGARPDAEAWEGALPGSVPTAVEPVPVADPQTSHRSPNRPLIRPAIPLPPVTPRQRTAAAAGGPRRPVLVLGTRATPRLRVTWAGGSARASRCCRACG